MVAAAAAATHLLRPRRLRELRGRTAWADHYALQAYADMSGNSSHPEEPEVRIAPAQEFAASIQGCELTLAYLLHLHYDATEQVRDNRRTE